MKLITIILTAIILSLSLSSCRDRNDEYPRTWTLASPADGLVALRELEAGVYEVRLTSGDDWHRCNVQRHDIQYYSKESGFFIFHPRDTGGWDLRINARGHLSIRGVLVDGPAIL